MLQFSSQNAIARLAIAVILGGGRGTRLWPLTKYRAKPAVPLAGNYRLIDIPISNCLNSGLDRIYILTQFNSDSLNQHIIGTYRLDHFSQGFVSLQPANQSVENAHWYQGTADAVRQNLSNLRRWQTPYVVILPGDTIFRMDLTSLLSFHIKRGADLTVALHPTCTEKAPSFGLVRMNEEDQILHMGEKPAPEELEPFALSPRDLDRWKVTADTPYMASMGIYVFRTELLAELLSDPSVDDFGIDILPRLTRTHRVSGFVFDGFWEDIGTIGTYFQTNLALAQANTPFKFYHPTAPIYTHPRFLPPSRLHDVRIKASSVASGCDIEQATIDTCIIGNRSVIGRGVTLRRTIDMGADFYEHGSPRSDNGPVPPGSPFIGIGEDCHIEGTIIDKNARLGRGVVITDKTGHPNYDDPRERYYIRDGIVIIPKNSCLEDGTVI